MKTIYKTIEMIRDCNVFAAVLVPTVLLVLTTCVSLSKSAEYAQPIASFHQDAPNLRRA
jgi:hypothetical protein